jgi:hypothetical protein
MHVALALARHLIERMRLNDAENICKPLADEGMIDDCEKY